MADQARDDRGSLDGFDIAVWAELTADPSALATELPGYAAAGATWWVETARPGRDHDWMAQLVTRVGLGV